VVVVVKALVEQMVETVALVVVLVTERLQLLVQELQVKVITVV
jgi:hypothetical protein